MYISNKLKWLKPYLDIARPVVPETKYLKKILINHVNKHLTKKPGHLAKIKENSPRNYTLSMYTEYVKVVKIHPEAEFKIQSLTKIDMLMHLAHELAHMRFWDHCPKRQMLESSLTVLFMAQLEKEGYISEEVEENKKY